MAYAPGYGQNGNVDTAQAALVATSTRAKVGVCIKVVAANTKTVYVGNDSSVTSATGYPVVGGDFASFDTAWFGGDLANIYVAGSENDLTVAYWWV